MSFTEKDDPRNPNAFDLNKKELSSLTVEKTKLSSTVGIYHAGYLTKQGGKRKNLKRRYFILCNNRPVILYFSTDQPNEKPKGVINLCAQTKITVSQNQSLLSKSPWVFQVETLQRTFFLLPSTEVERDLWINKINQVLSQYFPTRLIQTNPPNQSNVNHNQINSTGSVGTNSIEEISAITPPPETSIRNSREGGKISPKISGGSTSNSRSNSTRLKSSQGSLNASKTSIRKSLADSPKMVISEYHPVNSPSGIVDKPVFTEYNLELVEKTQGSKLGISGQSHYVAPDQLLPNALNIFEEEWSRLLQSPMIIKDQQSLKIESLTKLWDGNQNLTSELIIQQILQQIHQSDYLRKVQYEAIYLTFSSEIYLQLTKFLSNKAFVGVVQQKEVVNLLLNQERGKYLYHLEPNTQLIYFNTFFIHVNDGPEKVSSYTLIFDISRNGLVQKDLPNSPLYSSIDNFLESLKQIEPLLESLFDKPWFFGIMESQQAEKILNDFPSDEKEKKFLVRYSSRQNDPVITIKDPEKGLLHVRLVIGINGEVSDLTGQKKWPSLEIFIENIHLKNYPTYPNYQLRRLCKELSL